MPQNQHILPTGLSFPQTVGEISRAFDARIREGRLEGYLPVSTGFDDLDHVLGGGFLSGCLLLLGGRQNVGKTVWALQAARNVAMGGNIGCLVCYEHSEVHLFHRLLCMESYLASQDGKGLTLRGIRQAIVDQMSGSESDASIEQGLQAVLQAHPSARNAWSNVTNYLDHLFVTRGHPVKTTLNVLRTYVKWLQREWSDRQVVLFIDYLQKVPYSLDSRERDKEQQVVMVTEGLKNLALELGISIVAVAAVDPAGLKRDEPRVEDLLGSSAVKYEPDAAIMMLRRRMEEGPGVGFAVGKNRAGPTGVEFVHPLVGRHFCFDPQPAEKRGR